MPLDIIVGAQWGDEGKGRVVDLLAQQADVVARYNGGDNAGHTVSIGESTFKLHLIPSGIIHPHTVGMIGNGVVVNPGTLLDEIETLRNAGIQVSPDRLQISYAAHLITPAHCAIDQAQEASRGGGKIGTTLRGIGPAYTDKVTRTGLRMEAMLYPNKFRQALIDHVEQANQVLTRLFSADPLDPIEIADLYSGYADKLSAYIGNVSFRLASALKAGQRVLAEGAQGCLLDLDHGTYPFVTSSNPTTGGALVGLGLGVNNIERVIGVTKVFQTRVGSGPFPTEVDGETAIRLRGTGENPWDEFGTTTGRPRRVGWLDTILLRYACRINGLTELVLTKLDVLTGLHPLKVCIAYCSKEQVIQELPFGPSDLTSFEPIYEELPGWDADLRQARRWEDLPASARAYILRIEELSQLPVRLVSVGPQREQIVEIG